MTMTYGIILYALQLAFWSLSWRIPHTRPWEFALQAAIASTNIILLIADGCPTWQILAQVAVAVLYVWSWWKRRPPRKPRRSRMAGRVVDVGHRLVVSAE